MRRRGDGHRTSRSSIRTAPRRISPLPPPPHSPLPPPLRSPRACRSRRRCTHAASHRRRRSGREAGEKGRRCVGARQAPPRPCPPAVTRRAPPRIRSPSPAGARRRSPHWRGGGGEGGRRWGWEGGEGRRPGERSSEGETGRGARREQWGEDNVRRGRRKKNLRTGEREREGVGRMKKIGGEHITAGSYYNPAVMLMYHRRFVIRPGGDALNSMKPPLMVLGVVVIIMFTSSHKA